MHLKKKKIIREFGLQFVVKGKKKKEKKKGLVIV